MQKHDGSHFWRICTTLSRRHRLFPQISLRMARDIISFWLPLTSPRPISRYFFSAPRYVTTRSHRYAQRTVYPVESILTSRNLGVRLIQPSNRFSRRRVTAETLTDVDFAALLLASQSTLHRSGIGMACQAKEMISAFMKRTIANWRTEAAHSPGRSVRSWHPSSRREIEPNSRFCCKGSALP
jgi:hypothetical protein